MPSGSPSRYIVIAVAVGFVCGFAGLFLRNIEGVQSLTGALTAFLDTFHQTFLLIAPDSHFADLPGREDTWLSGTLLVIGRLLLPFGLIAAVVNMLRGIWLPLFYGWRARHRRDHVLLAGMDRRGRAFADNILKSSVALTTLNLTETEVRRRDHIPLMGDATKVASWNGVALDHARSVVLTLPDEQSNLSALSAVLTTLGDGSRIGGRTDRPLALHVSIEDATTRQAFVDNESALKPFPGCEVRPFSVAELTARHFFNHHPLHATAREAGQRNLHLVLAGDGETNRAILLQFLRIAPAAGFDLPRLTLMSDAPDIWLNELKNEYPGILTIASFAQLVWSSTASHPPADRMQSVEDDAPATAIFTDFGDEEHNAVTARILRTVTDREGFWKAPIFFQARSSESLYRFFSDTDSVAEEQVVPLETLAETCSMSAIDGSGDDLAKAIHEAFLARTADAQDNDSAAGRQTWERLSETYRTANRRAADHLAVKRESLTYLQQQANAGEPVERREALARLEHESWCNDRILAGWRHGEVYSERRRYHPCLVPFERLDSGEKKKNRAIIDHLIEAKLLVPG